MAKHNAASVERVNAVRVELCASDHVAPKQYEAPRLFAVGAAMDLVQGNQLNAPYRDATNSGYTYWSV